MAFRVSLCLLLFSALLSPAFAQQAVDVARTLQALRDVKFTDEMGFAVPPEAVPLLSQLKHQLLQQFQVVVKEAGPKVTATAVSQRLLERLRAAGVQMGELPPSGYGGIGMFEIHQPPGHPELLVFVSNVGGPCDADSSLYVLERKEGEWRLAIAIEANRPIW